MAVKSFITLAPAVLVGEKNFFNANTAVLQRWHHQLISFCHARLPVNIYQNDVLEFWESYLFKVSIGRGMLSHQSYKTFSHTS